MFQNDCGEDAHEAIRLSFHDAVGISQAMGPSAYVHACSPWNTALTRVSRTAAEEPTAR